MIADRREPLLGRKKELADLRRLLRVDGARLVTITGPRGIGKSRLLDELAAELPGSFVACDESRPDAVGGALPVVATAREPLGADNEVVYALRPLAEAPAVELFRQRAGQLDASYAELAAACARLGALPLAIELAAVRAGAVGLERAVEEALVVLASQP